MAIAGNVHPVRLTNPNPEDSVENNYQMILIHDLVLDGENPRLKDPVQRQQDAIDGLIEAVGPKLLKLAQDILENGSNPCDLVMVFPTDGEKFVVAEGNRRVAALKLLANPSLAASANPKFAKKLEALRDTVGKIPEACYCVVVQSEEKRNLWIRRLHTGEN